MFPKTHDGSVFSDLHKDVYGFRPRGITFESMDEFEAEFERLVARLGEKQDEDEIRQAANWKRFNDQIESVQALVANCSVYHAVEIIADADGELDEFKFYGAERLEYTYDLRYGILKAFLKEHAE